jgi:hypothetical protein
MYNDSREMHDKMIQGSDGEMQDEEWGVKK